MKVTEHLAQATEPLISFEIIPPLRGGNVSALMELIDDLMPYHPPFIDITSHAAEVVYEELSDGTIQRRVKRKRPGTLGVCALIQNKYHVDAVPHILCHGFTREETEDFLIELNYLGIDNVLAVRGDDSGYRKPLKEGRSANNNAAELVQQISGLAEGKYIERGLLDAEPLSFGIGVGGYPERHAECPNMQAEVRNAKRKVEAGADYIVTQMFFRNEHYFEYVRLCREAGIEVPIIPGLKILTAKKQLATIPATFNCEIPHELEQTIQQAPDGKVTEAGAEWALGQVRELLERGVPSVHFYVMQSSKAVKILLEQLAL
jgi:methylenetetrahydrofolate reductase (NADPH)